MPKPPLLLRCLLLPFVFLHSKLLRVFIPNFNWWKPLRLSTWIHHDYGLFLTTFEYNETTHHRYFLSAWVYRHLRFLLCGHSIPLHRSSTLPHSPYKVFYNIFKPSTPFKKTTPPLPDFQVVVVKYIVSS